jgi:hypothetical protein
MPVKFIKRMSKNDVHSLDLRMPGNADVCPFTLEAAEGCKVRNSNVGDELCVFMLESCYFQERGRMRKLTAYDTGIHL